MDVKYGINESFTVDATVIPDFGQVVSDNLINNLSPFELRFQENRPFFTEGTELFNKAGLFYSRRVGAIPTYYDSVNRFLSSGSDYLLVKNPSVTQLYNGIKFSGRTKNNLGIGVFNAVAARMHARLENVNGKNDSLILTEPLTNYNIIVLDQALKGRSSVTFTNSNVIREGAERDANVSAFDWSLYNGANTHRFSGTVRYSKVFGYTQYNSDIFLIDDTVTMKGRLFLKPYDGYNVTTRFAKVSGKLQYQGTVNVESEGFDPNDLGYLQASNEVTYSAGVSYVQYTPTKNFLNYRHSLNARYNLLYRPYGFSQAELWYSGFWYFRNFWDVTLNVGGQPVKQHDYFELRTPHLFLQRPGFFYASANGSTDSRKKLFISFQAGYTRTDVEDGNYYLAGGGARFRFSNRFILSVDATWQKDHNQLGYAFHRESNGAPIVAYRKNTELTSVVSGIYNFSPRLNLTLRARHYWNKVNYRSFFDVDANGKPVPRPFINGQDENFNLFNLDAFVTWDFRLGSRIVLGWKNWLEDQYGAEPGKYGRYPGNLGKSLSLPHGNEVSLKIIFFLDYNQLFRK
jgi:hypothetical protein